MCAKKVALVFSSALLVALCCRPAAAQLQVAAPDGSSLKFGILGQFQGESIDNATATETSDNLFFRRLRLLGSFKLNDNFSFYLDTDNPNLGKGNADGTKNNADTFIQTAVATFTFAKEFQIDAGMILLAQSYNHNQSAATLLAVDYGAYTFNETTPTTARAGRDYGVQLRGYLADDHLEYRVGVFQGARGVDSKNDLRVAGRLAYYVFGPETGLFYRGTSLGKTQTLSIAGSFDKQQDYSSYGGDIFWDQPIAGGDGFTLQVDVDTVDGGTFLLSLPKQTDTLVEAGYYFHSIHLQPFIQYADENFDNPRLGDEKRTGGGLAYYFNGHNSNLKAQINVIDKDGAKKRNQFLLQYQIFVF